MKNYENVCTVNEGDCFIDPTIPQEPENPVITVFRDHRQRIRFIDILSGIIVPIILLVAYIDSELAFGDRNYSESRSMSYRMCIYSLSLVLECLIYLRYSLFFKKTKNNPEVHTRVFQNYLVEFMINLICPPPPWYDEFFSFSISTGEVTLRTGDVLLIFMFLRVYLLFRMFFQFSHWTYSKNPEKREHIINRGGMFAIKSDIENRHFLYIGCFFTFTLVLFAVPIKIMERGYSGSNDPGDMNDISNILWMIVVTMTTIGYGDYFPITPLGRLITALACVTGLFFVSLFIFFACNAIIFNPDELVSYYAIKEIDKMESVKRSAIKVIAQALKIKREKKTMRRSQLHLNLKGFAHFFYDKYAEIFHIVDTEQNIVQLYNNCDHGNLYGIKERLKSLPEMESKILELQETAKINKVRLEDALDTQLKLLRVIKYTKRY